MSWGGGAVTTYRWQGISQSDCAGGVPLARLQTYNRVLKLRSEFMPLARLTLATGRAPEVLVSIQEVANHEAASRSQDGGRMHRLLLRCQQDQRQGFHIACRLSGGPIFTS